MIELLVEVKEWLKVGELLVIMGNFNRDTAKPAFKWQF